MEQAIRARIGERLALLYGERAPAILAEIEALTTHWAGRMPPTAGRRWSERDALLITYADSIVAPDAAPFQVLRRFLRDRVGDRLSLVHLLPFFPWTSDDGFAVTDFRQVKAELGDWADVRALAEDYRLVFDGVVNHVSSDSVYMRGYLAGDPEYADFLVALPPATDTSAVLRTRNLPLLHDYRKADGTTVWLWTTFSRDQTDLNYHNPRVLLEILDVLLFYASQGAQVIRLDAIPYLWKKLGTSCAHLPETHAVIKLFRDVLDAAAPGVLLLTETNVPHRENLSYFGDRGDEAQIIYNFSLPPLILFALATGDGRKLTEWARTIEPVGERATYLNITATHDGIGMRPTEGLLSEEERALLMQLARDHHGDITGKRNPDGSVSPYELNLNYFDAVNHPDSDEPLALQIRRFLVSQAIPLSFLGIPGLYLHSLLGSRNDLAGVARTGRARSINREQLTEAELRRELANPASLRAQVFGELCRMLDIRRRQPAFHPDAGQEVLDCGPSCFAVRRTAASGEAILAIHNLTVTPLTIDLPTPGGLDLLSGQRCGSRLDLAPLQVVWLRK